METLCFLGVNVAKENFHIALTVEGTNFYDQEVKNNPISIKEYFQALMLMKRFCFKPQQTYCLHGTLRPSILTSSLLNIHQISYSSKH
jgi:hypothetical protein